MERLYRRPFLLAGLASLAALSTAGASGLPAAGAQDQDSTGRDTAGQEPDDESPPVRWLPDAINARAVPGQAQTLSVTLRARDDLSNVQLWLSPALRPFVTLQPESGTPGRSDTSGPTPSPSPSPTSTPTLTPTPAPTGTPTGATQGGTAGTVSGAMTIKAGVPVRLSLVISLPADATEEDEAGGVLAVLQNGLPVSKRLLVHVRARHAGEPDDSGGSEAGAREAGDMAKGSPKEDSGRRGATEDNGPGSDETAARSRGRAGDVASAPGDSSTGKPDESGRSGPGYNASGEDGQKRDGRRQEH